MATIGGSNQVTVTVSSSGVVGSCEINGQITGGCQRFCYLVEQTELYAPSYGEGKGPSPLTIIGFNVRRIWQHRLRSVRMYGQMYLFFTC